MKNWWKWIQKCTICIAQSLQTRLPQKRLKSTKNYVREMSWWRWVFGSFQRFNNEIADRRLCGREFHRLEGSMGKRAMSEEVWGKWLMLQGADWEDLISGTFTTLWRLSYSKNGKRTCFCLFWLSWRITLKNLNKVKKW